MLRTSPSRGCRAPLVASAALAGLVGLGGFAPAHAAHPAAPTTITFWNGFSGPDGAALKTIVAGFNASQKDVTVDMTIIPQTSYGQTLSAALSARKGPDIIQTDIGGIVTYASTKVLAPIGSAALGAAGLTSDKFAALGVDGGLYNGKLYGIPMNTNSIALYWNKAVFRAAGLDPNKPPTTEAEFLNDARKMTHGDVYGFVVPPAWPQPFLFPTLLAQFGGQEVDASTKAVTFNSAPGVRALALMKSWIYTDKIAAPNTTIDYDMKALPTGKAGMIVDGVWQYKPLTAALGADLGAGLVPRWGTRWAAHYGLNYLGIYNGPHASAQTTAAALRFMRYFEDNILPFAQAGNIPLYKPALDSTAFKSLTFERTIASGLPHGVNDPKLVNYGTLASTALYPQIDLALLGKKDPKAALDAAATQITKATQGSGE